MDSKSNLLKNRTAIMGFAALWVYMFHEHILLFETIPVIGRMEEFIKSIGCDGVEIFFFLSGIGLTYSINRGSIGLFYLRRIERLIIPFVFVGILRMFTDKWSLIDLFGNISCINFITDNIYSLVWFVPAITILYLLFPLYNWLIEKRKNYIIFSINAILIWYIISIVFQTRIRSDLWGFTNRIPVFLVGVLLGKLIQCDKIQMFKGNMCILLIGFIGFYLSYQTNYNDLMYPHMAIYGIPSSLIAIFMVWSLSLFFTYIEKMGIGFKYIKILLDFFGEMSLEFYCLQEWMGEQLIPYLARYMPNWLVNIALFVCVSFAGRLLNLIGRNIVQYLKRSI